MISSKSITEASRELRNLDVRNGCKRQQRHVEYSGGEHVSLLFSYLWMVGNTQLLTIQLCIRFSKSESDDVQIQ